MTQVSEFIACNPGYLPPPLTLGLALYQAEIEAQRQHGNNAITASAPFQWVNKSNQRRQWWCAITVYGKIINYAYLGEVVVKAERERLKENGIGCNDVIRPPTMEFEKLFPPVEKLMPKKVETKAV